MNLKKLYEIQGGLDHHILKEKELDSINLIDEKFLAFNVEVGELANEVRCFKYWTNKPPSNKEIIAEEYVDGLHFILSIGNDIGIQIKNIRTEQHKERTLTKQFNRLFREISNFHLDRSFINYFRVMNVYLALGEMLDFTQEEIEKAYMIKNLENHKRQRRGY